MDFQERLQAYAEEPITRQIVLDILKEYRRPNDKINALVQKGELLPLKNGLYIPGAASRVAKPEPFLIANFLLGPSYVSLESALSFWGFIPERVFEVTSVTVKAARTYDTPIGRFSYFLAPLPYYSFGIKSVSLTARQVSLVASGEKALCDKLIMSSGVVLRSPKQAREFLLDDLRMEEELLQQLDWKEIQSWTADSPKRSSVEMVVKTLQSI